MSDLISRKAALDALEWKWAGKSAIDAIKNLPSADAVPVVRCKDCKHRPMKKDPNGYNYGFNLYSPTGAEICPCIVGDNWYSWTPQDNFFCAYGERKDDV